MKKRPAHRTILLVEDDEQVRGLVRNLLSGNGYTVLEARTGSNGVQVAQDHAGEIDLLVADMLLPELSGFDLAQQLRSRFPRMKVLFMTGYVEGDIVQKCVGELGASFLDKPFQPAALVKKVREILDNAEGAASNG
ncbi:MAG: response regulator [Acidobacteria bacterium]|nr:response regulator [Acidobacteriota bacterium]